MPPRRRGAGGRKARRPTLDRSLAQYLETGGFHPEKEQPARLPPTRVTVNPKTGAPAAEVGGRAPSPGLTPTPSGGYELGSVRQKGTVAPKPERHHVVSDILGALDDLTAPILQSGRTVQHTAQAALNLGVDPREPETAASAKGRTPEDTLAKAVGAALGHIVSGTQAPKIPSPKPHISEKITAAATAPKPKILSAAEARRVFEAQGAAPGVAARAARDPRVRAQLVEAQEAGYGNQPKRGAKLSAATAIISSDGPAVAPRQRNDPLGKKTLGRVSTAELEEAARKGTLQINRKGKLTVPATRQAARNLKKARARFVATARPDASGLSSAERALLPYVLQAHKEYPDIPVSVMMAQIKQESGFNPAAESSAGAFGATQFIPSTAESYGVQRGTGPAEIQSQVTGQAHLLHDDNFASDPQGALSAYSGGYAADEYNNPILEDAQENYGHLDEPTHADPAVTAKYRQALAAAEALGLPTKKPSAEQQQQNYLKVFGKEVGKQLQYVQKGQYDKGPGTIVPDSGVSISQGHEPEIAARLKLLSAKIGKPIYIISGYRSPQHSVEVGGFADDPHTEGEAADIGIGSPTLESAGLISEAEYESVGLHRPFYPESAHEINHVQLLNNGTPSFGSGGEEAGDFIGGGSIGGAVGGATAVTGGAVPAASGKAAAISEGHPVAIGEVPVAEILSPEHQILPGPEEEGAIQRIINQRRLR